MMLIGQYDSPFVRRVGIAMTLYGLPFEHKPWSVFSDVDKIKSYNPLLRVPVLVLDNGDVLIESQAILDYLDGLVPVSEVMFPKHEPERHQAIKIASLATGLADKAVSLFYETRLHKAVSEVWVERCKGQIQATLEMLELHYKGKDISEIVTSLGHADIATASALRHFKDAHPSLLDISKFSALNILCSALEALPVFKRISQEFIAPA